MRGLRPGWFLLGVVVFSSQALADHASPPRRRRPLPVPTQQGTGQGSVCTRLVTVRATEHRPGCWIDERVTGAPGTLRYPCEGDGPASITFARARFDGAVTGGTLSVQLATQFHWGDGCDWQSTQVVTGAITGTTWQYSYREAPRPRAGQRCSGSCEASAVVEATAAR